MGFLMDIPVDDEDSLTSQEEPDVKFGTFLSGAEPTKKPIDTSKIPPEQLRGMIASGVVPESPEKTFVQTAARSIIPTAAGLGAGSVVGSALTGSLAGPVGTIAGLIGGLGAMLVASWGVNKIQEIGLEKVMGPEKYQEFNAQMAANEEAHPIASFAGGAASMLPFFRPSPSNLGRAVRFAKSLKSIEALKASAGDKLVAEEINNLFNVTLGAGTMSAMEAYSQVQSGNFEPVKILANMALGATMTQPWLLGKAFMKPTSYDEISKGTPQAAEEFRKHQEKMQGKIVAESKWHEKIRADKKIVDSDGTEIDLSPSSILKNKSNREWIKHAADTINKKFQTEVEGRGNAVSPNADDLVSYITSGEMDLQMARQKLSAEELQKAKESFVRIRDEFAAEGEDVLDHTIKVSSLINKEVGANIVPRDRLKFAEWAGIEVPKITPTKAEEFENRIATGGAKEIGDYKRFLISELEKSGEKEFGMDHSLRELKEAYNAKVVRGSTKKVSTEEGATQKVEEVGGVRLRNDEQVREETQRLEVVTSKIPDRLLAKGEVVRDMGENDWTIKAIFAKGKGGKVYKDPYYLVVNKEGAAKKIRASAIKDSFKFVESKPVAIQAKAEAETNPLLAKMSGVGAEKVQTGRVMIGKPEPKEYSLTQEQQKTAAIEKTLGEYRNRTESHRARAEQRFAKSEPGHIKTVAEELGIKPEPEHPVAETVEKEVEYIPTMAEKKQMGDNPAGWALEQGLRIGTGANSGKFYTTQKVSVRVPELYSAYQHSNFKNRPAALLRYKEGMLKVLPKDTNLTIASSSTAIRKAYDKLVGTTHAAKLKEAVISRMAEEERPREPALVNLKKLVKDEYGLGDEEFEVAKIILDSDRENAVEDTRRYLNYQASEKARIAQGTGAKKVVVEEPVPERKTHRQLLEENLDRLHKQRKELIASLEVSKEKEAGRQRIRKLENAINKVTSAIERYAPVGNIRFGRRTTFYYKGTDIKKLADMYSVDLLPESYETRGEGNGRIVGTVPETGEKQTLNLDNWTDSRQEAMDWRERLQPRREIKSKEDKQVEDIREAVRVGSIKYGIVHTTYESKSGPRESSSVYKGLIFHGKQREGTGPERERIWVIPVSDELEDALIKNALAKTGSYKTIQESIRKQIEKKKASRLNLSKDVTAKLSARGLSLKDIPTLNDAWSKYIGIKLEGLTSEERIDKILKDMPAAFKTRRGIDAKSSQEEILAAYDRYSTIKYKPSKEEYEILQALAKVRANERAIESLQKDLKNIEIEYNPENTAKQLADVIDNLDIPPRKSAGVMGAKEHGEWHDLSKETAKTHKYISYPEETVVSGRGGFWKPDLPESIKISKALAGMKRSGKATGWKKGELSGNKYYSALNRAFRTVYERGLGKERKSDVKTLDSSDVGMTFEGEVARLIKEDLEQNPGKNVLWDAKNVNRILAQAERSTVERFLAERQSNKSFTNLWLQSTKPVRSRAIEEIRNKPNLTREDYAAIELLEGTEEQIPLISPRKNAKGEDILTQPVDSPIEPSKVHIYTEDGLQSWAEASGERNAEYRNKAVYIADSALRKAYSMARQQVGGIKPEVGEAEYVATTPQQVEIGVSPFKEGHIIPGEIDNTIRYLDAYWKKVFADVSEEVGLKGEGKVSTIRIRDEEFQKALRIMSDKVGYDAELITDVLKKRPGWQDRLRKEIEKEAGVPYRLEKALETVKEYPVEKPAEVTAKPEEVTLPYEFRKYEAANEPEKISQEAAWARAEAKRAEQDAITNPARAAEFNEQARKLNEYADRLSAPKPAETVEGGAGTVKSWEQTAAPTTYGFVTMNKSYSVLGKDGKPITVTDRKTGNKVPAIINAGEHYRIDIEYKNGLPNKVLFTDGQEFKLPYDQLPKALKTAVFNNLREGKINIAAGGMSAGERQNLGELGGLGEIETPAEKVSKRTGEQLDIVEGLDYNKQAAQKMSFWKLAQDARKIGIDTGKISNRKELIDAIFGTVNYEDPGKNIAPNHAVDKYAQEMSERRPLIKPGDIEGPFKSAFRKFRHEHKDTDTLLHQISPSFRDDAIRNLRSGRDRAEALKRDLHDIFVNNGKLVQMQNLKKKSNYIIDGKSISLDREEKFSLLMDYYDPDIRATIVKNGIEFPNGRVFKFSEEGMKKFFDSRDAFDKALIKSWEEAQELVLPQLNTFFSRLFGEEFAARNNYWIKKLERTEQTRAFGSTKINRILAARKWMKERVSAGEHPVKLQRGISDMHSHLDDMVEFTGMAEPIYRIRSALNNPKFQAVIKEINGESFWKVLEKKINQIEGQSSGQSGLEQMAGWLYRNTDVARLAGVTVPMKNWAAIPLFLMHKDARLADFAYAISRPKWSAMDEQIFKETSPTLWNRYHEGSMSPEVGESMGAGKAFRYWGSKTSYGGIKAEIADKALWGMRYSDRTMTRIAWRMAGRMVERLHPDMKAADRVWEQSWIAEDLVNQTQQAAHPETRSVLGNEPGILLKGITRYTSQPNKLLNSLMRSYDDFSQGKPGAADKLLEAMGIVVVANSILVSGVNWARDRWYDFAQGMYEGETPKRDKDKEIKRFFSDVLDNNATLYYGTSLAISPLIKMLIAGDKNYERVIAEPVFGSVAQSAFKAASSLQTAYNYSKKQPKSGRESLRFDAAQKKALDVALKQTLDFTSQVYGLPLGTIRRYTTGNRQLIK